MQIRIGVIGGSGLENPDLFTVIEEHMPDTPFGLPSSTVRYGKINGVEVVLLSRHGKNHTIPPSMINYRANIHALKEAGCTHILTSAACGSLRKEIAPGDIVIPDQLIDFTHLRKSTFYEEFKPGIENLKHTAMPEPFDTTLRHQLYTAAESMKISIHQGATLVTIEGPRFATRAESRMFRLWGADLINMTIATETILANELNLPYATVAMITDYDSWNEEDPPLQVTQLLQTFANNVDRLTALLVSTITTLSQ